MNYKVRAMKIENESDKELNFIDLPVYDRTNPEGKLVGKVVGQRIEDEWITLEIEPLINITFTINTSKNNDS